MIDKLQFMTLMFLGDLRAKHAERDERGATAVEYGLLVSLIAVAIIFTVTALGTQLSALFATVTGSINP